MEEHKPVIDSRRPQSENLLTLHACMVLRAVILHLDTNMRAVSSLI